MGDRLPVLSKERLVRRSDGTVRVIGLRWSAAPTPLLFELIRHLGDGGLRTTFVALLATGRSADADGADGFIANLDRHAAAERDHVREHALALVRGLAALGPFERCLPERSCRVSLATREIKAVRRRGVAADPDTDQAHTIDHRD